jgi:hypothetical protein
MTDDPKGPLGGRPSLNEALRLLAERERRSLGEHPTPEELAAYRNGELTEPEADRIRNHLALCHDCADLLLDLANFGHLEPPEGVAPASEAEVDGAWESLRSRIAEAEALPEAAAERSAPVVPLRAVPPLEASRRDLRPWALAAMVIVLAGLMSWNMVFRYRFQAKEAPTDIEIGQRRGGAEPGIEISAQRGASLHFDDSPFEAEVLSEDGKVVLDRRTAANATTVLIEGGELDPGQYRLRLYWIEGGQRELATERSLRVAAP